MDGRIDGLGLCIRTMVELGHALAQAAFEASSEWVAGLNAATKRVRELEKSLFREIEPSKVQCSLAPNGPPHQLFATTQITVPQHMHDWLASALRTPNPAVCTLVLYLSGFTWT